MIGEIGMLDGSEDHTDQRRPISGNRLNGYTDAKKVSNTCKEMAKE